MIAPNLISDSVSPVNVEDNVQRALAIMRENNISQLAVIEAGKYIGLVTMEEIARLKNSRKSLKSFQLTLRKPFVQRTAHIFEVMKAAVDFNTRVVPVVDEELNYLGMVSAESCLRAFALLNSVNEAGAIIELETGVKDYSLSEVARIVEDSDATILCLYTNIHPQDSVMEITLKVNTTDINAIISSFQRFDYEVKAVHNETEYTEEIKDRYDSLMRYLNV